jgi:phytoene dehydrogenase-like protein
MVYARGGPGALADALAAAVRSFGGEIVTGVEVASIASRDGRVTGVTTTDGREYRANVVASGADPKRTLVGMVDPVALGPTLAWRAGNLRLPGVVSKVNLALSGLPVFPGAEGEGERLRGRIVIAPSVEYLERGFDASKYGETSEHPYLEATIPSLSDPTLAPDGTHVMSVLVQWTPYHRRGGDWDADRDALGDSVLATLEGYAPGLSSLVTARQVITPLDLERDYGLTEGHPMHGEQALDQFFAWRPLLGHARYRIPPIDGLYLVGSGAHPGGGVTGGPGMNAAREILADLKAGAKSARRASAAR